MRMEDRAYKEAVFVFGIAPVEIIQTSVAYPVRGVILGWQLAHLRHIIHFAALTVIVENI